MDRAREFRNFLPITLPNCADPTRALYLFFFLVPGNQNETQSNMNSIEVFAKYRAKNGNNFVVAAHLLANVPCM